MLLGHLDYEPAAVTLARAQAALQLRSNDHEKAACKISRQIPRQGRDDAKGQNAHGSNGGEEAADEGHDERDDEEGRLISL